MTKSVTPVRWSWTDTVISAFSPSRAVTRYAARATIANLRRMYEAGDRGRGAAGWASTNRSADSEIAAAGSILRDRSRDLVRNNPLAASAVQVLVNNIVGPGIRPRAASRNKRLNQRVNDLFLEWSKRCDAHGHTDFHGILALAVREMVEGGEVLAVKRMRNNGPGVVPLAVELREADHLDDYKQSLSGDEGRIAAGIQYDRSGRRTGYWMFPDHPGDNLNTFGRRHTSVFVPDSMVAHMFERQRVQSRGVPWAAPAMRALQDLGDWQVAEMVRKKTEACMVGVVVGDDEVGDTSVGPTVEDENGNVIESFSPGMIAYARNGKAIEFNNPPHAGGVQEWNRVQQHLIAAGFRVPYAVMTGDLSQANFSSNRAGLNEFRRMVDQIQWTVVIPMLCDRIWSWFIEAAYADGLIDTNMVPVEWAPPAFESVNPWQDAQTDLLETRAGFRSISHQIAKRGYDADQVFTELSEDLKKAAGLGLVLDSDPAKVTTAGQAQSTNPDDNQKE